jgi:3-oxoacyl-[acyl-carrier protein] reductase
MKRKIAIVTGCSSGLGFLTLKKLISDGFFVYGVSNNKFKIKQAIKKLKKENVEEKFFKINKINVSNYQSVKKYIRTIKNKEGTIHALINNAGIYGPMGFYEKSNFKNWKKAFNINFFGCLNFYKEILPLMKKMNFGRIVQIAGGGATKAFPMFTSYGSAKAAIVRFSETIYDECRDYNIKINSIAPGALNTHFLDIALKAGPKKIGNDFYKRMQIVKKKGGDDINKAINLISYLSSDKCTIGGKLISSLWDKWENFEQNKNELNSSDVYTLRRIIGKDRNLEKFDV